MTSGAATVCTAAGLVSRPPQELQSLGRQLTQHNSSAARRASNSKAPVRDALAPVAHGSNNRSAGWYRDHGIAAVERSTKVGYGFE
jgi:hypothetical protein